MTNDDLKNYGMELRAGVEAVGILLGGQPPYPSQYEFLRAWAFNFLYALEQDAGVPVMTFGSTGNLFDTTTLQEIPPGG